MSLLVGALFLLGLITLAVMISRIWSFWQKLDLFPCPECESSKVEHPEGVDGAFNRCLECGKEWRDDEPI